MKNLYEQGQMIETTVAAISNDTVFIDLGLKSEGFVNKSEFCDENGNCSIKEGDKIKVYFLGGKNEELHFTTKLAGQNAGKSVLENAFKNGIPVEGHVTKEIKGGFEVMIGTSRAFCMAVPLGTRKVISGCSAKASCTELRILSYMAPGRSGSTLAMPRQALPVGTT